MNIHANNKEIENNDFKKDIFIIWIVCTLGFISISFYFFILQLLFGVDIIPDVIIIPFIGWIVITIELLYYTYDFYHL